VANGAEELDYSLHIKRWDDCPEVWWEGSLFQDGEIDLGPEFHLPQGLVARLTLRLDKQGRDLAYHIQEARGAFTYEGPMPGTSGIQIAQSDQSSTLFVPEARGSADDATGRITITFLIHVPQDAALGPYCLDLSLIPTRSDVQPLRMQFKGVNVVRPKVFIVDIDGMRQDIFYGVMAGSNAPEHLARIFGTTSRKTSPITVTRGTGKQAEALRFTHGYMVRQATSTFPTYTFAAQAPIVTGALPKETGFPGNEWLDRAPTDGRPVRRYSFTGGDSEPGMSGIRFSVADTMASYSTEGLANSMLRAPTVYDTLDAQGIQSLIGFHMYEGSNANGNTFRVPAYRHEQIGYAIALSLFKGNHLWFAQTSAHDYDEEMLNEVGQALWDSPYEGLDFARLGVIFLYFAHLDHSSHQHLYGNVFATQQKCLQDVDAMLGTFMDEFQQHYGRTVLDQALWVVTADHGQTDCKNVITPNLRDEVLPQWYTVEGTLVDAPRDILNPGDVRFWMRNANECDCSVGYNGGSAHIYLRALDPLERQWDALPTNRQVIEAAERIRQLWLTTDAPAAGGQPARYGYSGKMDLMLVRLGGDSPAPLPAGPIPPYSVYDKTGKVVTLATYLRSPDCIFYSVRYGWTRQDVDLIEEAINGMNCDRSGDIVLIPTYPDYEFEISHSVGQHGSLVSTDMSVPLAAAIPAVNAADPGQVADRILKILSHSVDLKRKPRPGNRDVPDIVMNFHKQRCTPTFEGIATGAPVIETRRSRRDPLAVTEILVKAPIISELKTGSDGTYETALFELWAAQSADGPFAPVMGSYSSLYCDVSPATRIDPNARTGRISQDEVLFAFGQPADRNQFSHKPFYFKVLQKLFKSDSRLVLSEKWSNLAEPGRFSLRLSFGFSKEILDTLSLDRIPSEWVEMQAALGYENQAFDHYDVHFTVQADEWTGHFWSPRAEEYSDDYGRQHWRTFGRAPTWQRSEAEMRFPFRLGGQTVQIQAQVCEPNASGGEGEPVMRSIRVEGPAAEVAEKLRSVQEKIAKHNADLEQDRQSFNKSKAEDWPKEIARIQKENEALARKGDSLSVLLKAQNDHAMIGYNWWSQEWHNIVVANRAQANQEWVGRDCGDWRQVLDSLLDQLADAEPEFQVWRRYFDEKQAISVAAASARGAETASIAAGYDREREKQRTNYEGKRTRTVTGIAQCAVLAGDADNLSSAVLERLRLAKTQANEQGAAERIFEMWRVYAGDWAMVTGRRDEAARIFMSGWQEYQNSRASASQAEQGGQGPSYTSWTQYYAWWPDDWTFEGESRVPSTSQLEEAGRRWERDVQNSHGPRFRPAGSTSDLGVGAVPAGPAGGQPAGSGRDTAAGGGGVSSRPAVRPADVAKATAYSESGMNLWKSGKVAEAEAEWRKAVELDPTSAEHIHNLASAMFTGKKYVEAEQMWRRATVLAADNAKYVAHHAMGLSQLGMMTEAEQTIRRAITLSPNFASAHNQLGAILDKAQKPAEAEQAFRKAISLEPTNGLYHANLAGVLLSQNKQQEALQEAEKGKSLGQNSHPVYERLVVNRAAAADQVSATSGPEPNLERLSQFLWSNQLNEALQEVRRLSQTYPNHAAVGSARVGLELLFNNMKDAKVLADRLYGLHPNHLGILIGRGQVALWSGDPQTARQMFDRVLAVDPATAANCYNQAVQFFDRRCYQAAYQQFVTVAAMSPNQLWMSRYYLGVCEEQFGRAEAAIAQYQAFLQQNPPADWANAARSNIARLRQAQH